MSSHDDTDAVRDPLPVRGDRWQAGNLRRCRRTTIAPGERVEVSFAGHPGLRVVTVVAGAVRTHRDLPSGMRTLLLLRDDVLCQPADDARGELENVAAVETTVVDAVLDVGDIGVVPSGSGPAVLGLRTCPVTAAVLDALTTGRGQAGDADYCRSAGHFLAVHVNRLLNEQAGAAPADDDPPGDVDQVSPQAFSAEQQAVLLETMRERLAERVRVEELAAVVGYSSYHFLRRFRATFGQTPYQYLIDLRVRTAQRWLEQDRHASLGWIAIQCGFGRTESLIRAFHQRVGTTPARYAAARQEPGIADSRADR